MPLTAVSGALIGQGINTGSSIASQLLQRHWNRKDYKIQRSDNLKDWHMQNEYNSPTQQMARLKAAGLNPHLVYGSGADAQMGAPIGKSDLKETQLTAPQFDVDSVIGAYNSTRGMTANIQNIESILETQKDQRALLKAQELNTLMSTKTAGLDYQTKSELQKYQLEAARIGNERMDAELTGTLINNHLQSFATQFAQETMKERIETVTADLLQKRLGIELTQQQKNNLAKDETLKEMEINIRKKGGNPNDPAYQKYIIGILTAIVKKLGYDMTELIK